MTQWSVDSRRTKLAGMVAERLIDDIVRSGIPAGTLYASEAELMEAYGVSRAVLREAVRLVEHQRVARMRRGPGGGLIVDEPDLDAVASALILYFARVDIRLDEVFEARLVLEDLVVKLAAHRIDETDIGALRAHVAAEEEGGPVDHRRLHTLLADATRNAPLGLFVEALNRMANFYVLDRAQLTQTALSQSAHAHTRIAEAVIAHRVDLARQRMSTHVRAEADYIRSRLPQDQRLQHRAALDATLGDKRAELIAADIFAAVMAADMHPGDLVGTETGLMARYTASRAVFREAVRILEHHHVALMKRGPHGGLVVATPNTQSVASVTTVYLARRGVRPEDLIEIQEALSTAIIERTDPAQLAKLAQEWIDTGRGDVDLHRCLGSMSSNHALGLLAEVVQRMAGPAPASDGGRAALEALAAADLPLTLHRMRSSSPRQQ